MRSGFFALCALMLAGCASTTMHGLLEREVGRSIAHATLVAGPPQGFADLPGGRRAFVWELPALVPTGGPRCTYTLIAELRGRPGSFAAWQVVEVEEPAPGCMPLRKRWP